MENRYANLFEPVKIGGLEIKNRYFMAPMGTFGFQYDNGTINQNGVDYYVERAKGGMGLIITGICHVSPEIEELPLFMSMKDPFDFMKNGGQIARRCHAYGTKVFLQLTAGFGRVMAPFLGKTFVAPSEVGNRYMPNIKHRALTTEEVEQMVKNFIKAAAVSKQMGFDGIEIHALHEGYLLDQFGMELFNKRTDKYGGSFENRYRFAAEIVQGIKAVCGKNCPVSLRYSPKHFIKDIGVGGLEGEEFEEKGRDVPEGLEAAKYLESVGYDALNVDVGSYEAHYISHPTIYSKDGLYVKYAAAVKEVVNMPVLVAGRLGNPDLASEVLRTGKADMIGLGRPSLADAYLPQKVRQGRPKTIRHCINCNTGCGSALLSSPVLSCAVNAQCGSERLKALNPLMKKKKVVVIGGGPGGMETARVAASRGHDVTLFEKADKLGGNMIPGGTPEFKANDHRLISWFENELKENGVKVRLNTEFTPDILNSIDHNVVIMAPGAVPFIPDIPGRGKANVYTASDVLLDINKAGSSVVIIGAGQVGCETGIWLAQKGRKVTLVEILPDILAGGHELAGHVRWHTERLIEFHKIDVKLSTTVKEIIDSGVLIENANGQNQVEADTIIFATGYTPADALYKKLRNETADLYIIGDGQKVSNVMTAIHEGYELANSL